ncbi:hypothetical protein [Allomuricauda sp.]|jgi:hypothetical protein|uniref:hypothetical protein n=1 Tax=Flagellimonas sp. TaxID=2058762 RepID=UPI0025D700BB|nr:hypothetical protein [Allomuricauda sp.]
MEVSASYYLWHPKLEKNETAMSIISFNLTPTHQDDFPNGPESFYAEILKDMDVHSRPLKWQVLPYRSNYLGEETEYWEDMWKKAWRISIQLADNIEKLPNWDCEEQETYAFCIEDEWYNQVEGDKIHCIVIADFKTLQDLNKAKQKILSVYEQNRYNYFSSYQPKFEEVSIGNGMFYQLQIDIGTFADDFFANGANYAKEIENICRAMGGITNFDERIDKWDEYMGEED